MADSLSVVILAGGSSKRMRADKAFLKINGRTFIRTIYEEASKISEDILVVIGSKPTKRFRRVLGSDATIIKDTFNLDNPMGGMLSALEKVKNDYVAFIACDLPLVKSELIKKLFSLAYGHSAAVPRWSNGTVEPLCAVYQTSQARQAGMKALDANLIGCQNLISFLADVLFVDTQMLRGVDPDLRSFMNINSAEDLEKLIAISGAMIKR
ncbi:MAG: molybdenum cofactor guanylyltransferase [Nitrososphaerota archaeon]|nr:molybdenum cofactor guanylyltransferase [Nitrososphaerota archaeon]